MPTHSSTASAPIPSVSSLMRTAPSSPRSVTMSVAPNSRASFWRASWRLIATIRLAPICLADSTAAADRAVTDDCHRHAGLHVGRISGEPAGAKHIGDRQQARDQVLRRHTGVGTSVPSASGTRSTGACARVMNSRWTHDDW